MNFFVTMTAECVGPDSALRKVGATQCTRGIADSGYGCRPLPPPFGYIGAMRASSRAQGIRPSIHSRKISRRVLRSHSRLAKVNCRRRCMS